MEKVIENFLRYVKIDTRSEDNDKHPSTEKQHVLAKLLYEELLAMGAKDVVYDREHCYVYATVPGNTNGCKTLGFIAHMDTSPDVTDTGVNPRIVKQYDGKDIVLSEENHIVLSPKEFPSLLLYKGKDLIVTDGRTLLGADDKAGIAEIMAMAEFLLKNPDIPHATIKIGFTPDEEVGAGADFFDLSLFDADFAYTVDGGRIGELEYENFNAAGARVIFHGRSVHPGDAKGKMKNAILLAQEFQSLLPVEQNPMYTEKYEGFYHLEQISGTMDKTVSDYIIRDHSREQFEAKKELFRNAATFLNEKYGENTVEILMHDSYYNMREIIEQHMHLVENAKASMEELDIEPIVQPIRGGTDGARLSFMGLPCPNLGTGGHNFHSRFEYACVESMEKNTELLIKIAEKYA